MSKENLDFIKEFLDVMYRIIDTPRQVGKTTALREAAEKINGFFITASKTRNEKDYDIALCDVRSRLAYRSLKPFSETERYGFPIIFDTTTLKELFGLMLNSIDYLERQIEKLNKIKEILNE